MSRTRRDVLWNERWPLAGLALFAIVAVGGTLPNAFVGDDLRILYDPERLPDFWSEVLGLWTRPYYDDTRFGIYRPLFMETVYLQSLVFGARNALASHAINIAVHVAVTTSFYAALRGLTRTRDDSPDGLDYGPFSTAFAAALLFAVHPWHIEPVSQLVGRAELLATLFALLALRAHQRGLHPARAALWYGLALFTKESAAVLPALIVAVDAIGSRRLAWRRIAWLTAPLLLWLAVRFAVLGQLSSGTSIFINPSLAFRLPTVGYTYLLYVSYGLWPVGLSYDYSDLFLTFRMRMPEMTFAAIAALAIVAIHAYWGVRRRRPELVLGAAWFTLSIALFVHVLTLQFFLADRFAYLASLGLCLWVAGLAARLPLPTVFWRWVAVACIAAFWTGLSIGHARVYRSSLGLLEHSIALHLNSPFLNYQLSVRLTKEGRDPERAKRLMSRYHDLKQIQRAQARGRLDRQP